MTQLLAHLLGDYVLQNHWMANTKTTRSSAALLHALFYTLPFLLLTQDPWRLAVIGGTHFVIDRFRLARYWVDFWGVGKSGRVLAYIMGLRGYVLGEVLVKPDVKETRWVRAAAMDFAARHPEQMRERDMDGYLLSHSLPYVQDAPPWLGVWLLIIVDNTMHLCINAGVLGA